MSRCKCEAFLLPVAILTEFERTGIPGIRMPRHDPPSDRNNIVAFAGLAPERNVSPDYRIPVPMQTHLLLTRCSIGCKQEQVSSLVAFRFTIGHARRCVKWLMKIADEMHDPGDRDRLIAVAG